MKGFALFAATALGLLALAFYLGRAGQATVQSAVEATPEQGGYDFTARDVTVQQTDAAGRLLYVFSAEEVQQATDDAQIAARNLTLRYDPPETATTAQRWTVRADTAQLPQQDGVLTLSGNVEARGTPPKSGAILVVRTDTLDYDLHGERLRTSKPVRFEWNGSVVTGTGLDADLKSGKLQLKTNVRGRITP
jgi:LPS export ABC transporter protein LptC